MAGALDSLFKSVAKSVVADLGKSFDHTITYTRKASPTYNTSTGALTTTDTAYSFDVPVEFVDSEEEEGREERKARLYITPDQIGDNQPTFEDTVTLKYAGSNRVAQITDIRTFKGDQEYLYQLIGAVLMAKSVSEQIKDELEAHLQQSYNRLIATIMRRLATKKRSPVYTGFFASSWKRTRLQIVADAGRLKTLQTWSGIRKRDAKIPLTRNTRLIQGFIRRTRLTATSVVFTSAIPLSTQFMR